MSFPFPGDPLARIGLVVLALILLISVGALLVPGLDSQSIAGPRFSPPTSQWLLGTDALGRDLLPRLIEATRTTVLISVAAVLVSTVIAIVLGITAAVVGGAVDQVIMRLADGLFAFPAILLGILVSAIVGAGAFAAIFSIIVITLPLMMRVFRGASQAVTHRDFVSSASVGGASRWRIAVRHILPNITGPIIVQATYAASLAMLIEGALSFLGFGVVPPAASLGSLVQEGSVYLTVNPSLALVPGFVLAAAILAVNLVGDGLRNTFEPRTERALV
ncbi:ABC transporter permease (plasmid) [Herbiconiux sp. KACC 21604]|uniref:ABC transporter permease n=1 Tax=unclassified Herbiconiux TaxID=2618217 RepID=UPI00149269D2|nr:MULTISPECIES: ABC transporter permease [unclassified Herbiconiux]QJU56345.1 ABC transporter permease [Herbiconiux sp. SALV-R1]WPO88852.1 ABC transporter permease [Herbiconiux sp. KACC 21604]